MDKLRKWFRMWQVRRAMRKALRPAKGVHLENIARMYGLERNTDPRWWVRNERDATLRARCLDVARRFAQ